jgi:N-acetylmuramoyl-L-alanine amidase
MNCPIKRRNRRSNNLKLTWITPDAEGLFPIPALLRQEKIPAYVMFRQRIIDRVSLLLIILSIFTVLSNTQITMAGQKNLHQVEERYNKAKDYYYLLLRDKDVQKERKNWVKGIREFRRIYLDYPKGQFAANSLFMMAKMHYRMYMRFNMKEDMDQSISYYTDVYSLFPDNTLADDALFWIAEIYRKDKENPGQAAKLYAKQIKLYPKGDKYGQAASRLQELKGSYAIDIPQKYTIDKERKKLLQVLPVQYWSSDPVLVIG